MANLFAKKSMNVLMAESEATGEGTLNRTLGPFQLTALGVGAVIGAGIFVLAGLGAHYAGPGLMLSFVLSGLGCAFAGLCYAEFAAMIPLAGSAYTYAYATLGELVAWIIGWDLTLEYAMGASTVSSGWSNHFIELMQIFHIKFPLWLAYDHWTALKVALDNVSRGIMSRDYPSLASGSVQFSDKLDALNSTPSPAALSQAHALLHAPVLFGHEIGLNLPAFLIALLVTTILAIGIQESAKFNSGIVVIKVAVVLFVLGQQLAPVRSVRICGYRRGCGVYLLRLYRLRCGVDDGAGGKKPAARSAYRHHCVAGHLHDTVYRRCGCVDRHGAVAAGEHRGTDCACLPGPWPAVGERHHHSRRAGRAYVRDAGDAAGPDARVVCDGQ
jgi:hypothetical protein